MSLNFNSQGFLHQTITLTYEELIFHFGTTRKRMEQLKNALQFFRLFYSCGCEVGKFETAFPQFFDLNEMGRIHRELHCHIFTFNEKYTRFFDLLSEDREGNAKGFVKLHLKDLPIQL